MATLRETTLFRLYLARQALEVGLRLASDPLPYPRMQAVMALDDAAEWTTVTLLSEVGERPKHNAALPEHVVALVAKRPALASHAGPVEALRRLRDRVKHDGRIPDGEDARRAAVEVEGFVRAALAEVLGVRLEEISPVELVADAGAKEHLRAATVALAAGECLKAVTEAAIAFELGQFDIPTVGRDAAAEAERIAQGIPGGKVYAGQIREAIAAIEEPLVHLRVGIDPDELRRFKVMAPMVAVSFTRKVSVLHRAAAPPSHEQARFAIDFATHALLRLEDWRRRHPS